MQLSTNPYQIWLEANSQKLLLPVNPEKIDIKVNGNNQSVTVAELGEIVMPQDLSVCYRRTYTV